MNNIKNLDPLSALIYSSMIAHNRGFLFSKNADNAAASLCYRKAYQEENVCAGFWVMRIQNQFGGNSSEPIRLFLESGKI